MAEMNIPGDSIDSLVAQAVRAASGESIGFDIAKSLHKALLESNPKKKRKTKDERLNTDSGLILTSPGAISALNEKHDQEHKKRRPVARRKAGKK